MWGILEPIPACPALYIKKKKNALADMLTIVIALNLHKKIDKAKNSHKIHHQNAAGLRYEFHISRETAREIVMSKLPNI